MSLIKDVKEILVRNGILEEICFNIQPIKPPYISLKQYGGRGRDKLDKIDEDNFQIYVKHDKYEAGYSLIENIRDILFDVGEYISPQYRYLSFFEQSGIIELPQKKMGEIEFVINIKTFREGIK